jgi:tetratricopeptide (TPR) repeat protein
MKRTTTTMKWIGTAALLALLGACGSSSGGTVGKGTRADRNLVETIRAAGRTAASSVEVQPLRDSAVDGFVKQIADLENADKFDEALVAADRALKLAPDAPDLLQLKAELLVGLRRFAEAETLSRKSFELGPKLGSLCARNWQTVVETRALAKDEASAASARTQLAACKVPPRQRL